MENVLKQLKAIENRKPIIIGCTAGVAAVAGIASFKLLAGAAVGAKVVASIGTAYWAGMVVQNKLTSKAIDDMVSALEKEFVKPENEAK